MSGQLTLVIFTLLLVPSHALALVVRGALALRQADETTSTDTASITSAASSEAAETSTSSSEERTHTSKTRKAPKSGASTASSSSASEETGRGILKNKYLDKEYGPAGLKGVWIAVICLGVALLFMTMCVSAWCLRRRHKAKQAKEAEAQQLEDDIKQKQQQEEAQAQEQEQDQEDFDEDDPYRGKGGDSSLDGRQTALSYEDRRPYGVV